MARTFKGGIGQRLVNVMMTPLAKVGIGPSYLHILTVRGRKSGEPRSTPVDVMDIDGRRYLVAPYGPVAWVHNIRAAGEAELTRGRTTERFTTRELPPQEAAPVLRVYAKKVPVTRPYFEVKHDAPVDAFVPVALGKPVFEHVPSH